LNSTATSTITSTGVPVSPARISTFHGFDRPLVEPAAQTVQDPHVPHRAVRADHDFEVDIS
jgi:hypothetical protein